MSDKIKGRGFTVYLAEDEIDALKRREIEIDRSPSWIIRSLIREPLGLPPKKIERG